MEKVIVYTNPVSPVSEAYRTLCVNVLAGLGDKKLIEVVGVNANDNTSMIAANLAVAISQVGKKVLLIDCNLLNSKQHEIFGLLKRGLTDYLATGEEFSNFVQVTKQNNLYLLPAGTATVNPPELLFSLQMQKLLKEVKAVYDIVLLDVPPVEGVSDSVVLGTQIDGVLFVLSYKEDKVKQVQKSKEKFLQAGVNILGCVLDKV